MTRNSLRALGSMMLTVALLAPVAVPAQESKCSSCEAEDRERAIRRYQQDIERATSRDRVAQAAARVGRRDARQRDDAPPQRAHAAGDQPIDARERSPGRLPAVGRGRLANRGVRRHATAGSVDDASHDRRLHRRDVVGAGGCGDAEKRRRALDVPGLSAGGSGRARLSRGARGDSSGRHDPGVQRQGSPAREDRAELGSAPGEHGGGSPERERIAPAP